MYCPKKPSPNLPNMRAVYLWHSSLCFFEGTPVSLGRGTDFPFQAYGHPDLKRTSFRFTPHSNAGAKNPPLKDRLCYGVDLRSVPSDEQVWREGVNLAYVIDCYRHLNLGEKFFYADVRKTYRGRLRSPYDRRRSRRPKQIEGPLEEDVETFKQSRKPYFAV